MSTPWPMVRLGDVVTHRKQFVQIDDLTEYKRCRVQLHAQGIVLRDRVPGAEIKTKSQQVCRAGDFLVAEIDAKMGGFGIVPEALDGAIVSSHYFLFEVDQRKLDRAFLGWYCKTPAFREQVNAQGTTNYAAIRPSHVLNYTIPLPSLIEQRRIVARLDAMAERIEKANAIRHQCATVLHGVLAAAATAVITSASGCAAVRRFGDFSPHVTSGPRSWSSRCRSHAALRFYRAQDVCADGRLSKADAVFIDPPDSNQGATARLEEGDLLIVITGATVGRVGLFENHHSPGYVSQHVAICRLPPTAIMPRFAHWWLRSREGSAQLLRQRYGQGKPGLNLSNIRSVTIPVPTIETQAAIVRRLDLIEHRLSEAAGHRHDVADRYAALLPSMLNRAFAGAL